MKITPNLETWEVLKALGFQPDVRVISEIRPGLAFDFGNFKLSAGAVTNLRYAEVVLFTGVLVTLNSVSEVLFEMPRRIESEEQCAAWLAWNLDQHADLEFRPLRPADWLETGRSNRLLLPWIADLAAYEARPYCSVERDLARPILKKLKATLLTVPDVADVRFSFDGEVLKIRCGKDLIATAAKGEAWANHYLLKAAQLKELPSRLLQPHIGFSVWKGHLAIAHWSYEGVIAEEGPL